MGRGADVVDVGVAQEEARRLPYLEQRRHA